MPVPTPPKAPLTYVPIPEHGVLHPPMPEPKQPTPPTPKPKCQCTNHMGTPKQQFKSKQAALEGIIKHHLWTGKKYTVYTCPTSNKFHIAGDGKHKKPRRHDRPD